MGITVWAHVHGSVSYRVWHLHHFLLPPGLAANKSYWYAGLTGMLVLLAC